MPASKGYCANNAWLSGLFDCSCFAQMVFDHRSKPPEHVAWPLNNLLAGDVLECTQCISEERIRKYVADNA